MAEWIALCPPVASLAAPHIGVGASNHCQCLASFFLSVTSKMLCIFLGRPHNIALYDFIVLLKKRSTGPNYSIKVFHHLCVDGRKMIPAKHCFVFFYLDVPD